MMTGCQVLKNSEAQRWLDRQASIEIPDQEYAT